MKMQIVLVAFVSVLSCLVMNSPANADWQTVKLEAPGGAVDLPGQVDQRKGSLRGAPFKAEWQISSSQAGYCLYKVAVTTVPEEYDIDTFCRLFSARERTHYKNMYKESDNPIIRDKIIRVSSSDISKVGGQTYETRECSMELTTIIPGALFVTPKKLQIGRIDFRVIKVGSHLVVLNRFQALGPFSRGSETMRFYRSFSVEP